MPEIHVLEKHIAELIAAGEVVERPASVIKELTENAIDAGATVITVEIHNGGTTYMRVTDNGCGIARADVPKAFLRHATSKIQTAADLSAIGTLGFRGEALASICAMARVELLTRTESELAGTHYCINGGDEALIEDAGCPCGTTVLVRDLFYNTPARMKFLKKDVAEGNAIANVLDKLALSHPEVSVRFVRDGREALRTPGDGQLRSAVFAVYGREFTAGLMPVSYRMGGISVEGFVSRPEAARASRSMQNFFINGRYVKSQTASAALEQACRGAVMAGKFPSCVLQLHIPPEAVDVNVHPAKIEVRFITERPVFDAVYRAVCDAFRTGDRPKQLQFASGAAGLTLQPASADSESAAAPARPAAKMSDKTAQPLVFEDCVIETPVLPRYVPQPARNADAAAVAALLHPMTPPVRPQTVGIPAAAPDAPPAQSADDSGVRPQSVPADEPAGALGAAKVSAPPAQSTDDSAAPLPQAPADEPAGALGAAKTPAPPAQSTDDSAAPLPQAPAPDSSAPAQTVLPGADGPTPLRFVGELFSTYMLLEAGDEVIFIDKHAAHERILYERLKRDHAARYAQQLLTPAVIHPAKEETAVLLAHRSALRVAGFEIEEFGNDALLVRSAPLSFAEADVEGALIEIAAHLLAHHTELTTAHDDWILHNVACRAAIKAGDNTRPEELLALAQTLHDHPELRYCPHGRPIYLAMKRRELEKQFGRIQ